MTVIYTKYNAENNFVRTIYVKYGVKNIQRGLKIWVWKSTEFWNGKCVRTLYPALVRWWHWQFWRTILTSLMLSPVWCSCQFTQLWKERSATSSFSSWEFLIFTHSVCIHSLDLWWPPQRLFYLPWWLPSQLLEPSPQSSTPLSHTLQKWFMGKLLYLSLWWAL